jgi:hypothetical protein
MRIIGKSFVGRLATTTVTISLLAYSWSAVRATPAIGVTKTVIAQGAFPGDGKRIRMDDPLDIHNWILDFVPFGELGWHMHPGPVVVTVKQGTLTKFEINGCSHVYHAGETFEELPFKGHNLVEQSGAAAETVAVFFIPSGQPVRIDLPAPEPETCRHEGDDDGRDH